MSQRAYRATGLSTKLFCEVEVIGEGGMGSSSVIARPAPRLSVVVLTYNTCSLALDCIISLGLNLRLPSVEVVLFDNGSRDFDAEPFRAAWRGIVIAGVRDNLGPAGGFNQAVQATRGEYLMLLNSDTLLPEDNRLDIVLDFLDRQPDYAAATPLLTDATGRVQPWQTGHFPSLWRMVLSVPARVFASSVPRHRRLLGLIDTDYLPVTDRDVDVVAGAAWVVRRRCFDAVGGFSTGYAFYLEDTDLCRSFHQQGWRIRWIVAARVIHLWDGRVRACKQRQRLFWQSQDMYFRKWKGLPAVWVLRTIRLPFRAVPALERWRQLGIAPKRSTD